ncbi:MAG TPA: glucosamine-6-phosphate deaminase [Candidatus Methylomirabilis sp.]|nr:glucosamine-6-phosphate deaminase [Candidatus Methylomirabilis sp.]
MILRIFDDKQALGEAAATQAGGILRDAIRERGWAHVVAATGTSQFEFLEALVKLPGIAWGKVELFHLDEYVGVPMTHRASFCRYLQERLIGKTGITHHHLMDGARNPAEVLRETSNAIRSTAIDVAFVGIGENGHLAFNDPPADFKTDDPYILVELDDACRKQQVNEGWFSTIEEVPTRAISMSVRQILKAREIIAVVPDARKAGAVKACFEGSISPMTPASILRTHPKATSYLDTQSAAQLGAATLAHFATSAAQPRSDARALSR